MTLSRLALVLGFSSFALVAACGSSDTPTTDPTNGKTLSGLTVNGDDTIDAGETKQMQAVANYSDGTNEDVSASPDTKWGTSDNGVATVDATGNVTGVSAGEVDITATYQGHDDKHHVLVH